MANPGGQPRANLGYMPKVLRMPQIRHMKELTNKGATSNYRYKIVQAYTRRGR